MQHAASFCGSEIPAADGNTWRPCAPLEGKNNTPDWPYEIISINSAIK